MRSTKAGLALLVLAACAGQSAVRTEDAGSTPASPRIMASAQSSPAAAPSMAPAEAALSITADEIHRHIAYLASDALRGRDTPSPGLDSAAAYLSREFASYGLRPGGDDGGFIQQYALQRRGLDVDRAGVRLIHAGESTVLRHGVDFFAMQGAPDEVQAELVFAGTEIEAGAGEALRGRAAVVYVPGLARSRDFDRTVSILRAEAGRAGAAALVVALDPQFPASDLAQLAQLAGREARGLDVGVLRDLPVFLVRFEAMQRTFRAAGLDLDELRRRTGPGGALAIPVPGVRAELTAPPRLYEDHRAPNVIAVLPGADPRLRDTYVVFSAHFDHVDVGRPDAAGDSIYNGADDNASGTAALLAVARTFASMPSPPARSLVFLAVSGEEKGLFGSQYYSDHSTVPLEGIVANINVDMIGRNSPDSIVVIGQEYSSLGPLVHGVASEHAASLGLTVAPDLWPQEQFFFRSDQFHFARKEIPVLFFFAGIHEDYHRPSDHVEKIDMDKAARVARLIFLTSHEIASRAEPPSWTEQGLREVRALTGGAP